MDLVVIEAKEGNFKYNKGLKNQNQVYAFGYTIIRQVQ